MALVFNDQLFYLSDKPCPWWDADIPYLVSCTKDKVEISVREGGKELRLATMLEF